MGHKSHRFLITTDTGAGGGALRGTATPHERGVTQLPAINIIKKQQFLINIIYKWCKYSSVGL